MTMKKDLDENSTLAMANPVCPTLTRSFNFAFPHLFSVRTFASSVASSGFLTSNT